MRPIGSISADSISVRSLECAAPLSQQRGVKIIEKLEFTKLKVKMASEELPRQAAEGRKDSGQLILSLSLSVCSEARLHKLIANTMESIRWFLSMVTAVAAAPLHQFHLEAEQQFRNQQATVSPTNAAKRGERGTLISARSRPAGSLSFDWNHAKANTEKQLCAIGIDAGLIHNLFSDRCDERKGLRHRRLSIMAISPRHMRRVACLSKRRSHALDRFRFTPPSWRPPCVSPLVAFAAELLRNTQI